MIGLILNWWGARIEDKWMIGLILKVSNRDFARQPRIEDEPFFLSLPRSQWVDTKKGLECGATDGYRLLRACRGTSTLPL